jgi:hypothetical protein
MIWLTWRQQRLETLAAASFLAAVTLLFVLAGRGFSGLVTLVGWLNLAPVLVAVLFAAPLVYELEHRTYRLVWTQSITRRRWLWLKVAGAVAGTMLAALALSLLITWWRAPLDRVDGRLGPNDAFDFEGIVPYAYALFALALVLAIGTISRRLVAAVAGGFAGYLALRLPIQFWARRSFFAPVHFRGTAATPTPHDLAQAWILHSDFVAHTATPSRAVGDACFSQGNFEAVAHCMAKAGFLEDIVYQPASRFWALQGIEAAIFVAAAAALLALTAWWIRRRVT